ncbi:MAG: hypothetical protein GBAus27B_000420 [Mycoplasmataceae bacterium]|nr:MAG: hypothetical protein GBAus27B_000420 [Mycoplasmataceae bacterium]
MTKQLNTTEKKLKFHCSDCSSIWQLLVIRTDYLNNNRVKCLNACLEKWRVLLLEYCQEQIILDFARKEQEKEEKSEELMNLLNQLRKSNNQE